MMGKRSAFPNLKWGMTIVVLVALCGGISKDAWGDHQMDPSVYGEKTKFQKGVPLQFPDLQLVYLGRRQREVADHRVVLLEDFEITQGDHKASFTYHHGFPGEIAAQGFEINQHSYMMELDATLSIKDPKSHLLKDDELILWHKKDFDVVLKKAYGQK
jgi:hypothetical protein